MRITRLALFSVLVAVTITAALAAPVTIGGNRKDEPDPAASGQPVVEQLPPMIEKLAAGHAALAKQDLDAAERLFEEARKLDPKAPGPLLGLAEIAKLRDRLDRIEPLIRAAVAADPFSAEAHRALGRLHFANRDGAAAEAALKRSAELNPDDFLTQVDLGELYSQLLNRPDAAAEAFRRASLLSPQHAGARFGLGMALAAAARYDEAIAALEDSIRLAPQNVLPLLGLGQVNLARRRPAEALDAYKRVVALQPRLAVAHDGMGDAYVQLGDQQKALAAYTTVSQLAPTNPWGQFKLGNALVALKRTDDAERAYLAAIRANDRFAPGYNNLASLLVQRRERLPQALAWAQKAVELEPQGGTYWDTLGSVRLARNEVDQAIEAGRKAVALPPPSGEHHFNLALALLRKGARADAAALLRRALEIDANFASAAEARKRLAELGG